LPDCTRARPRRRAPIGAVLGAATLLVAAAPAGATGPSYPGETLSISVNGPAVAGQVTSFTASGTDADANVGGYTLNVYTKPTSVDPTCAPDDTAENNTWGADMQYEFHPVVGQLETVDPGPFSTVFKTNFAYPGQQIVCAYSMWSYDTAAAATLVVDVQPSPGSTTPGPTPAPMAAAKPVNTARPRVTRNGKHLTCRPGTWTGAGAYSYRWLVGKHTRKGATRSQLAITRSIKGRAVACAVTASNAAGAATARSAAYRSWHP
jgi:hypothetical protein